MHSNRNLYIFYFTFKFYFILHSLYARVCDVEWTKMQPDQSWSLLSWCEESNRKDKCCPIIMQVNIKVTPVIKCFEEKYQVL